MDHILISDEAIEPFKVVPRIIVWYLNTQKELFSREPKMSHQVKTRQ